MQKKIPPSGQRMVGKCVSLLANRMTFGLVQKHWMSNCKKPDFFVRRFQPKLESRVRRLFPGVQGSDPIDPKVGPPLAPRLRKVLCTHGRPIFEGNSFPTNLCCRIRVATSFLTWPCATSDQFDVLWEWFGCPLGQPPKNLFIFHKVKWLKFRIFTAVHN